MHSKYCTTKHLLHSDLCLMKQVNRRFFLIIWKLQCLNINLIASFHVHVSLVNTSVGTIMQCLHLCIPFSICPIDPTTLLPCKVFSCISPSRISYLHKIEQSYLNSFPSSIISMKCQKNILMIEMKHKSFL